MKGLELLELTSDELGGREPQAGDELTLRGVSCRVVEVTPPAEKLPSKWRRKPASNAAPKWRLLVEKLG